MSTNNNPIVISYKSYLDPLDVYIRVIDKDINFSINIEGIYLFRHSLEEFSLLFNARIWEMSRFSTPRIIKINKEVKTTLFKLVNLYCKNKYDKKRLHSIIKYMSDGGYVYIHPTFYQKEFSDDEINLILAYINYYETGSKYCLENLDDINNFSKDLKDKYYDIGYDSGHGREVYIGEDVESKRVCRYCGLSKPYVKFSNRSHTISEGLGNKKIFTNTECDLCNEYFGKTIENELIEYLQIFNVFFGIKGKNGYRTYQGKNFEFKRVGEKQLLLCHYAGENEKIVETSEDSIAPFNLHSNIKISGQDLYRAIVKFAIGIVPDNKLSMFSETIDWICKQKKFPILPKVASFLSYFLYKEHPSIIIFIKKDIDNYLPKAFCMFRYTCFLYLLIIPTTEEEAQKFSTPTYYDRFTQFVPFLRNEGWKYSNWSGDMPQELIFNILFNKNSSDDSE